MSASRGPRAGGSGGDGRLRGWAAAAQVHGPARRSGQPGLAHRVQEEECAYGQKDVTDAEDIGQRPRTRRRKDVSEEGHVRVEQGGRVQETALAEDASGRSQGDR